MIRFVKRLSGSGVAATVLVQGAIMLSGVASGVTLARSLGPDGRGEFAVYILWSGILCLLGDMGIGVALSYWAGKGLAPMDELWTIALTGGTISGIIFGIGGWLILPHFVPSLSGSATRLDLALAVLAVPVILVNGAESYLLLGRNLVGDYNSSRIATSLSYLGAIVWATCFYRTVHSFVVAYLVGQAAGLVYCTFLVRRRFHPQFRFNRRIVRGIASYGFGGQMASIAAQTNLRADQAVMSVVLNPTQLGLYVVAVSISSVLTPLMNALTIVILPRATRSETPEQAAMVIVRHLKLAGILSIPVVLLGLIAMPLVLPAFFGDAYRPAVICAQLLLFASIFQGFNALLGNGLRGLGRPGVPAVAEGIGMAGTLLLLFTLLPLFGISGAALASLAAYALVASIEFLAVGRVARVSARQLLSTVSVLPPTGDIGRRLRNALAGTPATAEPRQS